ncbi:diguanylate cyclase [Paenibacillus sp. LjRoot153]
MITFGFALLVVLIIFAYSFKITAHDHLEYGAKSGVFDLTNATGDFVNLDGIWSVYWHNLFLPEQLVDRLPDAHVQVPSSWIKYNMAETSYESLIFVTYAIKIRIPEQDQEWGIIIPSLYSAYRLFVNGEELIQNGIITNSSQSLLLKREKRVIYFHTNEKEIDLVMQVSHNSINNGGITHTIQLGSSERVASIQKRKVAIEMFLTGALFIMAVHHIGIYSMRRKEPAALYFGIFCLAIATRSVFVGETVIFRFLPNISWELAIKIEYLCLSLSVVAFTLFLLSIYPKDTSVKILRFVTAIAGAYSFIILFARPHVFTSLLPYFQYFIIALIGYTFLVFTFAIARKRERSFISAVGAVVLLLTAMNDVLYSRGIINTGDYVTLGLFAFVVVQSYILAVNFSKAFSFNEELAGKLQMLNSNLEEKVRERTVELERANQSLKSQALIDGLTGIANRRYFNKMFQKQLTKGEQFSLLLIDIDHFKMYNDTYGHVSGDECLKKVAVALQEEAENYSGYASRYGGEEFAVIAPIDVSVAIHLAERLILKIRSLRIPHDTSDTASFVTISCGLMVSSQLICTIEANTHSMLEAADEALYQAKRLGRNRFSVFVSDSLTTSM